MRPGVRREAHAFAAAVDGQEPRSAEHAELVAMADAVASTPGLDPSAEFAAELRRDLMAEAVVVLVAEPSRRPAPRREPGAAAGTRRRRLAAAITAVVLAGGGASLVSTSASALPGDLLYPVKRSVESAQGMLHRSDASRIAYDLERASERLSEVTRLTGRDVSAPAIPSIESTLDEFTELTSDTADRVFAESEPEVLEDLTAFAEASSSSLDDMSGRIPEQVSGSHAAAEQAVEDVQRRIDISCPSCRDVPRADIDDLRRSVEEAAQGTPEAATEEAPESSAGSPQETTREPASEPAPAERSGGTTSSPPSGGSAESGRTDTDATSPRSEPPATESTPRRSVLDPVTGLLLGDPNDPKLLGGLR